MRHTRTRLLAFALALVLPGCGGGGGTTGPTGPPTGTFNDLLALIDRSLLTGAALPTDLDSTAAIVATLDVEGVRGAFALFPTFLTPTAAQFSDAGTVSVRTGPSGGETALDKQQLVVSGFTMNVYSTLPSHPAGVLLAFDGATQHRFTVSGSTSVVPFVDSVLSVSRPNVSAPSPGATITRSAGLPITWTAMGSDTTVYVTAVIVSMIDSSFSATATIARDIDATATIAAGPLTTLPPGAARLSVARYRIQRRDAGARRINLVCEAVTLRALELQ